MVIAVRLTQIQLLSVSYSDTQHPRPIHRKYMMSGLRVVFLATLYHTEVVIVPSIVVHDERRTQAEPHETPDFRFWSVQLHADHIPKFQGTKFLFVQGLSLPNPLTTTKSFLFIEPSVSLPQSAAVVAGNSTKAPWEEWWQQFSCVL